LFFIVFKSILLCFVPVIVFSLCHAIISVTVLCWFLQRKGKLFKQESKEIWSEVSHLCLFYIPSGNIATLK